MFYLWISFFIFKYILPLPVLTINNCSLSKIILFSICLLFSLCLVIIKYVDFPFCLIIIGDTDFQLTINNKGCPFIATATLLVLQVLEWWDGQRTLPLTSSIYSSLATKG